MLNSMISGLLTFPFYLIMSYLTYDLDNTTRIGVFLTLFSVDILSYFLGKNSND
jgi:hypothetical protein